MARVIFKHGLEPDKNFNHKELARGTKVELEHTNQTSIAKQIAKSHLTERPDYYQRLKKARL